MMVVVVVVVQAVAAGKWAKIAADQVEGAGAPLVGDKFDIAHVEEVARARRYTSAAKT